MVQQISAFPPVPLLSDSPEVFDYRAVAFNLFLSDTFQPEINTLAAEAEADASAAQTARNEAEALYGDLTAVEAAKDAAANSATASANSATDSANSATDSANSATASANSATASEQSRQAAEALYGDLTAVENAKDTAVGAASSASNDADATAADRVQTGLDRTAAAASEARANEWAESGVEVEPGQYSAKYWAGQASQIITDGVIDDNATNTEKTWSSQKVNDLVVRWLSISTSSALSAMGRYAVDFTSGPLTLTLPSSPSADDFVEIYASAGDATSSTIARNGQTIMGLAEDLTLNYAATWLRLVFNGTDWRIVA